ncbi:MAG: BrnT family toxin [Candidatus Hydrogenedentes bacterium]|nr:BrnT family toxin [Candidatus Hydrogenedentota bacterium]
MALRFGWDGWKAAGNLRKHKVPFEEAATAFADSLSLTIIDPSQFAEERFVPLGMSFKNRILVVIHAERGDNIRIISVRRATKREREQYEHV